MTRESGDRAAFLATMTRAVAARPAPHHRPVEPMPAETPLVAYAARAASNPVVAFSSTLANLGGVVRVLQDAASLDAFVADALATVGKPRIRVALTDEPECAAIAYALGARDDVELVDYVNAAAVATADVGFTGARTAVARTGSIVVDSGRAGGRTVSLLPPLHVALVRTDAIVDEPGDHWRSLGASMPSNLVQITGPSRSADVELVITLGVHGPRALWVGLLDPIAGEQ